MENRVPCKGFNQETGQCDYRRKIRPVVIWQVNIIVKAVDEKKATWADKDAYLEEGQYIPSGTEAPRPYDASDERLCAARGNTEFITTEEGQEPVAVTPFDPSPGFNCNRYIPENGRGIDGADLVSLNPRLKMIIAD